MNYRLFFGCSCDSFALHGEFGKEVSTASCRKLHGSSYSFPTTREGILHGCLDVRNETQSLVA